MSVQERCCEGTFWLYVTIISGLVLFAGLMSGLTLGLMSLGLVDLEVLIKSGTPTDQKHAAKILPVVKNQHLLLCTLLIGNSLAMEALPIFLNTLISAWGAVLISVTLVLMFGEIFPQAICCRHGLAVGAAMVPIVRVLVFLFFPVTYPISKLLDLLLGKGHVALFCRAELKTLVSMHGNEAGKGGELTHDETTIIAGALELTEKTATDAMTPISEAFAIDVNAKLDMKIMNLIMTKGHSRVPVYSGNPTNIIGLILAKNLLCIQLEDEIPVRNVTIRKIPRVRESMPLYDILNEFQKGHSHMAAVVNCIKDKEIGSRSKELKGKPERKLSNARQKRRNSDTNATPGVPVYQTAVVDILEENAHDITDSNTTTMSRKHPTSDMHAFNGAGEGGATENAFITQRVKKRERTGAKDILDICQEPLPNFPQDEEVIGIITLEDVIEELLQEEILDETDEYIDLHNKIKVNMLPPGGRSPVSPMSSTFPTAAGSPLSFFQQAPPVNAPIESFQSTPLADSPPSLYLQVTRTTPTVSVSPNISISGSPLTFFLSASPQT